MGDPTAIDLDEPPDESATLANVDIQGTHTSFPDSTATLSTPSRGVPSSSMFVYGIFSSLVEL